jgi:hypothetical protein
MSAKDIDPMDEPYAVLTCKLVSKTGYRSEVKFQGVSARRWGSVHRLFENDKAARWIEVAPDLLEELEQQADGTSAIIAMLVGQPGPVAASLMAMLKMQEAAARAAIAKATA